ncbi:MAG: PD40 domain-containing protein [Anaerolineaceae bacterium]|nr:PD40 domain-containing protein [Anaerolineaceae bacterium]
MLRRFLYLLLFFSASCGALSAPTPPPTNTPTNTPTVTQTPSPTLSPTPALPTSTPTNTSTPTDTPTNTPTPTITPTPFNTPEPTIGFVFDNWQLADVPTDLARRLADTSYVAFVNQNDRDGVGDVRTPQPATNVETLYYMPPTNSAGRVAILQLPSSSENEVYISASGTSIAYFLQDSGGQKTGLYVLDLETGIGGRILPVNSLVQRGRVSEPAWSPDGAQLAMALATGYDMDIFVINKDGTGPRNLTPDGAYEFWPVWSPDGRYIVFVSDRLLCPSWIPGDENACDANTQPAPNGGNVFVTEVATGQTTLLSDQWVTEPPRWLNNSIVTFASGDPTLGDPERTIWFADTTTGQAREVRLLDGSDGPIRLSEAWSPDGASVLYQSAGTTSELILANANGAALANNTALLFPRFGMVAAWSPDGTRVAIGGVNGQCPYGVTVLDTNLNFVARGTPPPSMCDPAYSPDGRFLVFTGVIPNVDGRVDVYIAGVNGFGAVNMTGGLRGTITLLGWVGG